MFKEDVCFTFSEPLSGHRFTQGHSGPTTVDWCALAALFLWWQMSVDYNSYYTAV